jgi:hypothetical protein
MQLSELAKAEVLLSHLELDVWNKPWSSWLSFKKRCYAQQLLTHATAFSRVLTERPCSLMSPPRRFGRLDGTELQDPAIGLPDLLAVARQTRECAAKEWVYRAATVGLLVSGMSVDPLDGIIVPVFGEWRH